MIPRERIALALDLADRERVVALAEALAGEVGVFKIGSIPYAACGPQLVREVARWAPVFLDLKFHDIPHTVAGAVREAKRLGVAWLTVHAAGGKAMIEAAAEAARAGEGVPPVILAVTVLTHLEPSDLAALGISRPLPEQVEALADLALAAGADGVVCSPHEVAALRKRLGPQARIVVPGIRPSWAEKGDQRRTAGPAQALADGADLLVVGRPILEAADPPAAARRLRAEG